MARRTLKNGVAIVTGASSGIGREIARQLATAGASVVINARRTDRLKTLADEIRSQDGVAVEVAGDICDAKVRKRVVAAAMQEFGAIDFLINNAGIGAMGLFAAADPQRMRQIMEVNFFAPVELIRESLPHLSKSDRAIIVNVGSVLGHRAVGLKSEYCASKFALHGFSDALRAELVTPQIDVLLVSPSTTDSEFFDAAIEDASGVANWKKRGAIAPALVARKTLAAMRRGASEIILSPGGKLLVWLDRLAPGLANRLIARDLRKKNGIKSAE